MEDVNINKLLNREEKSTQIKDILMKFEENKGNALMNKGVYIYGDPGSGKSTFITEILKELDYDVIVYDAGDIRNKTIIDNITSRNMSDKNIMSLFNKKVKKIAIIMDEIDGMNSGDKGGINSLIKLIRPKKTKKQKLEEFSMNPIICIGNYHIDKKIKELMKVCHTIELKSPTSPQIKDIMKEMLPDISKHFVNDIIQYVQGDLRKLNTIYNIYKNNISLLNGTINMNIFQMKNYNYDTKKITYKLMNQPYSFNEHNSVMNETDRTIIGLLWHENIIDVLDKMDKSDSIDLYLKQLDNICFADYIDRITFQKQIWQFNEMSSLIKTFKNNKLHHDTAIKKPKYAPSEVRFTKVLTKYSTEYNNTIFIQNLCQQLGMDKKDLFAFFIDLKDKYSDDAKIMSIFENYEISKLDINRIFRYLDKYTNETTTNEPTGENEIEIECDINDNILEESC